MIHYQLEYCDGRPVIRASDGQVIPPACFCDCILWDKEVWTACNRDFTQSDVHLYFLTEKHDWNRHCTLYWTGEGEYPTPPLDDGVFCYEQQARAILALDPEARFYVRFGEFFPKAWVARHPDEMARSSTGEVMTQASLASDRGWADFGRYVTHLVRYCESRPWRDRIVGYMSFQAGEGLTILSCSGFTFDHSPVMQRAFQAYLLETYASDADLQAAWGDPTACRAAAAVPTEAEWQAKRRRLKQWPDPAQTRRERDYFALQARLFRRYFRTSFTALNAALGERRALRGIDALKQPMLGWMLNLAFGREDWLTDPMADYPEMTLGTGAIDIADLLADDNWDICITPSDYTARSVGYGWESEGVNDSLRLYGKAMLVENDARTWRPPCNETLGAFLTPAELRAGLLRNTAWTITRGHLHYWMNVSGARFFHDELIHTTAIRDERRLLNASAHWPHRETEHAIALILDDSSPRHENGTARYQQLACLWQRHLGLAHCGLPYRVYLWSDLAHDAMPAYRAYLFPNLFELNDERLDLLHRRVLRDGRLAILGPATGITDGRRLSADGLSRLMGVAFELVDKQAPRRVLVHGNHRLTARLPAALTYGDSLPYGPLLVPTRAAVDAGTFAALGSATTFFGVNKPGLILTEAGRGATGNGQPGPRGEGDYALLWSIAMPLPANLLREAARHAGAHIWCEEDDVILASDTVAAIHTVKPGPRTLTFPTPRPVWDLLTGQHLGDGLTHLDLTLASPETRLFYTGPGEPGGGQSR